MDDDSILYDDATVGNNEDPNPTNDLGSDGGRRRKRPRLSPETNDDTPMTNVSTSDSTHNTPQPVSITKAGEDSVQDDTSTGEVTGDGGTIPGLFLVTDDQNDMIIEDTETGIENKTSSDHSTLAEAEPLQKQTDEHYEQAEINENEAMEEEHQDDIEYDTDSGEIRDMDDFLEKGKANLGDPEAEWQLDSSADELEDGERKNGSLHSPSARSSPSSTTSSSSEADSSSDGSDEQSSDDEGEEDAIFLDIQKEARRLMDEEAVSDDETGGGSKKGVVGPHRTKNELPEAHLTAARPNIDISSSTPIVPLGTIDSVVDALILVKASVSGEYQVLNEQSLLCFEDRTVLGSVQETFGRVEQPYYTVLLKDGNEATALNATVGRKISYVPSHSTFLFTKSIRALKGSDASNLHDEEVGDDEREFSDDEAEAEYKKRVKEERKAKTTGPRAQGPPGSQNLQNDAVDEPYVPLSRPANLHEMSAPPPPPSHGPSHRSSDQRRDPPPRMQNRDNQGSNKGFRGKGRARAGRQGQNRFEPKSNQRNAHMNHEHARGSNRGERQTDVAQNMASNHQQKSRQPTDNHSSKIDNSNSNNNNHGNNSNNNNNNNNGMPTGQGNDLSALLPFFMPGQPPPNFPSGTHFNPSFFPVPPGSQVQFPNQLGQIPPPPLPLQPGQFPAFPPPLPPPSVEDILKVLRAQGHNV